MHLIMSTDSELTNKKDNFKCNDDNATTQSQDENQNYNN